MLLGENGVGKTTLLQMLALLASNDPRNSRRWRSSSGQPASSTVRSAAERSDQDPASRGDAGGAHQGRDAATRGTLPRDRGQEGHAAAGVAEHWLVDLPHGTLDRFATPGPDGYAPHVVLEMDGSVGLPGLAAAHRLREML